MRHILKTTDVDRRGKLGCLACSGLDHEPDTSQILNMKSTRNLQPVLRTRYGTATLVMKAISRRILVQVRTRTSTLPSGAREVNESPRPTVTDSGVPRLQVAFSKIEVYALPSVCHRQSYPGHGSSPLINYRVLYFWYCHYT